MSINTQGAEEVFIDSLVQLYCILVVSALNFKYMFVL